MHFRVIDQGAYGPEAAKPTITVEDSIIVLNLGMRPTGGWSIEPLEVTGDQRLVTIKTKVNGPRSGSIVTEALTSPYVKIDVGVHPAAVRWLDENGNVIAEAK